MGDSFGLGYITGLVTVAVLCFVMVGVPYIAGWIKRRSIARSERKAAKIEAEIHRRRIGADPDSV